MRESEKEETPSQVRELWHFIRHAAKDASGKDASWRLDGIQQIA
ncbi:hypothetical protein FACS1894168_4160 [Deltaproteobacteria bacterium]|nr:hypothetical protein FACS1894168_4160 [Deltaproteobacteria bacterium]